MTDSWLHSYVLYGNEARLLITPTQAGGLSRLIKLVGHRFTLHFNRTYAHTGTVWDARFRSAVIDPAAFILPCMIHIDRYPVTAGQLQQATQYEFSSCRHYAGLSPNPMLSTLKSYWDLGNTPFARETEYGARVHAGLSVDQHLVIEDALVHSWPLGDSKFIEQIKELAPATRALGRRRRGRPAKKHNTVPI